MLEGNQVQSRVSSDERQSARGSNSKRVKYVNMQALIDREILLDQMLQNFSKGESITELSIQLWYLINDIDVAATVKKGQEDIT